MKKLAIILLAAFALAACAEDPTVSIDKELVEIGHEGGSLDFNVESNSPWEILSTNDTLLIFSQLDGEGPATVHVTVKPNESEKDNDFYVTVVAHGKEKDALKYFEITQPAPAYIKFNKSIYVAEYTGEETTFKVSGNNPWSIVCDADDVEIDPVEGDPDDEEIEAADLGKITVTIPEYHGDAAREITIFVVSKTTDGTLKDTLVITQKSPSVTVGKREYPIKKMPDGRWWMTQSLSYSSKGIVISDGKCGVWYPCKVSSAESDSETENIISKGLLYADQIVFDTSITKTTCKKQEGKQGICPTGWHIPTKAEFEALIAAAPNLKDAGFNTTQAGYVQGSGASYANGFSYKTTATYFFSSTYSTTTQWYGLQIDANGNGKLVNTIYNYVSARPYACSLRCVRDEEE